MDVTAKNFNEVYPQIEKAVESADFIAIDGEFTGIRNGPDASAYDTPADYYQKLRDGCLNFLLVQVGICTFRFDEKEKKYFHQAYNFYVFPKPCKNRELSFSCQVSCIDFLSNIGFDFNKLFKEGIPYISTAEEQLQRNDLQTKESYVGEYDGFAKITTPKEMEEEVETVCKKIESFLANDTEENELYIEGTHGFLRKLVFQNSYQRIAPTNYSLVTKFVDNTPYLVVMKGKSKMQLDKEICEKEKADLAVAVGFTNVFKLISQKKKMIIGHNMILDLIHIMNRFFWPLPPSYTEFKDMVRQVFPRLIDTKYICSQPPLKDAIRSSVIVELLKTLKKPPFELEDALAENSEVGYTIDSDKAHEAGYDAYATGICFIALAKSLNAKNKTKTENEIADKLNFDVLAPYENKVYIMKIMDYSYIDLQKPEPIPNRAHIFHIAFPKTWKSSHIRRLFSEFVDVQVHYITPTSAWITLLNPSKATVVVTELVTENRRGPYRPNYTIMSYNTYRQSRGTKPPHYQNPSYQNNPYRNNPYQNSPYQNSPYQNSPYQNPNPNPNSYPYRPNRPDGSPLENAIVDMSPPAMTQDMMEANDLEKKIEKKRSINAQEFLSKKKLKLDYEDLDGFKMDSLMKPKERNEIAEKKRSVDMDAFSSNKKLTFDYADLDTPKLNAMVKPKQRDEIFEETNYHSPAFRTNVLLREHLQNNDKILEQTFEEPPWE